MKQTAIHLCGVFFALLFGWMTGFSAHAAVSDAVLEKEIGTVSAYLQQTVPQPEVGSVGGEWCVLGLARAGCGTESYFDAYRSAARRTVRETSGVLHRVKYTEYARMVLALTALGEDPADFAGFDVLAPLRDTKKVLYQGTSGAIWALLALDSKAYAADAARKDYLNAIADGIGSDGGWVLVPGSASDADLTAMALTALAPYAADGEVKKRIDGGLAFLSAAQNADGSFSTSGHTTSESTAQVLVTLCTLGISETDSRFVKNGMTVLEALLSFRHPDGGFRHEPGDASANAMATEQAFYALAAVRRNRSGKCTLWDERDAFEYPTAVAGAGRTAVGLPGKSDSVKPCRVLYPGKTFSDIAGSPARSSVEALAARGVLNGRQADIFDPEGLVTRAEFCSMVVRALGLEPVSADTSFADVAKDDWFCSAVQTAYAYGIINGVSETAFAPNDSITREQVCVMLTRAARLCGADTALTTAAMRDALAVYTDYRTIGAWAKEEAAFCTANGIFSPQTVLFEPTRAFSRAEMAAALFSLLNFADLL